MQFAYCCEVVFIMRWSWFWGGCQVRFYRVSCMVIPLFKTARYIHVRGKRNWARLRQSLFQLHVVGHNWHHLRSLNSFDMFPWVYVIDTFHCIWPVANDIVACTCKPTIYLGIWISVNMIFENEYWWKKEHSKNWIGHLAKLCWRLYF